MDSINQIEIFIGIIGIIIAIPSSIQAGLYIREQWRVRRKEKDTRSDLESQQTLPKRE